MAYREFYKRLPQDTSGDDDLFTGIVDGVSSLMSNIDKIKESRRDASDQYKYALDFGHFENDNKILNDYVRDVTREGKKAFLKYGKPTQELVDKEQQGRLYAADSKAQYERFKTLDDEINKRGVEDKYYDPNVDKEHLKDAAFGKDGTVNLYNRGSRLDEAAASIGRSPQSFKHKLYTADYIKLFDDKTKEVSTGDVNTKSTKFMKGSFWDPKTGKPGVTDDHAIDYIKSDSRVSEYYDAEINDQLTDEIKKMKASGDARTEWMKGLSEPEIKNELINDPSKNLVNSQEYGSRKRDLAKRDLTNAAGIEEKVSFEKKKDMSATGGLYANDGISHSNTLFNTGSVSTETAPGEEGQVSGSNARVNVNFAAPGGVLMINKGTTTGKPLSFDIESHNGFNLNTGKQFAIRGKQPFNMTGYQLQIYKKDGKPFPISASSHEELIQKIKSLTPKEREQLDPEPKIAFSGYSLDKIGLLSDLNTSTVQINEELGRAIADNDQAKVNALQQRLSLAEGLKQDMNDSDVSDSEIISAAARNGIIGNRINQIVQADQADLDKLNNITQGLNLRDKNKWSPEMREVDAVYRSLFNTPKQEAPVKTKSKPVAVKKVVVLGTDGKKYNLPADQLEEAKKQGYKLVE